MKIDNHTHVFNLHFIPVAGVVHDYSEVFLGQGRKIPKWICRAIAKYYLHKTTEAAKFAKPDFGDQTYGDALSSIFSPSQITTITTASSIDDELKQFILDEEADTELASLPITLEQIQEAGFTPDTKISDILNDSKIKTHFVGGIGVIIAVVLIKILGKWAYKKFLEPHLSWFNFMTKPYEEITKEMIAHFKEIDLFVHLDMDMDDWYTLDPPTFNYEQDQVPRISKLVKESNGKVVPFYAYNPKKPLQPLIDAINSLGYIGVKFYPPSGYLPIGNTDASWDQANLALYDHCVNNTIPILSHCNQVGMQAGYQIPKKGNPLYWENVLNYVKPGTQTKPYENLTLCFGHSGGDEEWFLPNTPGNDETFFRSFCGDVYRICTENKNVYCDLSYMHEITDDTKIGFLRTRLKSLFVKSVNEKTPFYFEDKIIYGSDWHMIMQEHGSDAYLPKFFNLFKDDPVYEKKFFTVNVLKYLNLPAYISRHRENFLTPDSLKHLSRLV